MVEKEAYWDEFCKKWIAQKYITVNLKQTHIWPNKNEGKSEFFLLKNFFFFAFLGPHPRDMEVPRLGV